MVILPSPEQYASKMTLIHCPSIQGFADPHRLHLLKLFHSLLRCFAVRTHMSEEQTIGLNRVRPKVLNTLNYWHFLALFIAIFDTFPLSFLKLKVKD